MAGGILPPESGMMTRPSDVPTIRPPLTPLGGFVPHHNALRSPETRWRRAAVVSVLSFLARGKAPCDARAFPLPGMLSAVARFFPRGSLTIE